MTARLTLPASQRGSAVVLVLWGLVAIALAAGLAVTVARDQGARAGAAVLRAQAHHAADGALYRGLAALMDAEQAKRLVADGRVLESTYLGADIWLQVQDEAGKIDINAAEAPVLGRLLVQSGLPEATVPETLAAWRERRGEIGAYRVMEQLVGLPGLDAARLEALTPDITVFGSAVVDPWSASRRALLAATGLSGAEIDAFLLARTAEPDHPPPLPDAFTGTPVGLSPRRVFGLHVQARITPDGPMVTRRMVVRLTGVPARPYEVLDLR
jgi:general secretion pathway protein K